MQLPILISFSLLCLLIYICNKLLDSGQNIVKYYGLIICFCIKSFLMILSSFPKLLFMKRHHRNIKLMADQLRPLFSFNGLKWQIQNKELLTKKEGAIIVTNHQSILDILVPLIISNITNNIIGTTKMELWWTGILGWVAYKCGYIFINRKYPKKAYQTLEDTIPIIKTQGAKLWIYPEGTRNTENSTLLPFKKGAFVLAVKAQIPIIAVVCSPHYFFDEKRHIFYKDGQIIIKVLPALSTEGLTLDDVPALQEIMRDMMTETYRKLGKEIMDELPENYPFTKEIKF